MTLAVFDTNILVSALLSDRGNGSRVVGLAQAGEISICLSPVMLDEYVEVLTRTKFSFAAARLHPLIVFLRSRTLWIDALPGSPASPDPTDTKFIACAIAARADFLVTGNCRHFPEPRHCTAAVVSARELLARLNRTA